MRKSLITLALSFAAFAPVAAFAGPISYDAVNDFSISNGNPNGVWSYGSGTTTSFTAYTVPGTDWGGGGYEYWSGSTDGLPVVGYNNNSVAPTGGLSTVGVPDTQLWLHPGPASSGQDTIVRFTSQASGTYNLSSEFTRDNLDNGGNGVIVTILAGGSVLATDTMSSAVGTTYSFDDTVYLSAGEIVTFDLNNNGDYSSDSTGFDATFDNFVPAPEPSSLALFGTGILGLTGFARRRFKA